MKKLYIIIPCYNEEDCLPKTAPIFLKKLSDLINANLISEDSMILFVNDGSSDSTWNVIELLSQKNNHFCGIGFDINRGHQNAITAGMMEAIDKRCDITVTIDVDLQDDIDAVDRMIELYYSGTEIVCGVRDSRKTDSFMKRFTARSYYRIMNVFGARLIYDHADYRLMSADAVERLLHYHENPLFIRGLVTRLGKPIGKVMYDRSERAVGKSKYTIKKMLKLAASGISCNRMKPMPTIREPYNIAMRTDNE